MISVRVILIMILQVITHHVWAQGCSDAGVCSIGGLDNSLGSDSIPSSLIFSNTSGFGEAGGAIIYIQTTQLESNVRIASDGYFNVKIPLKLAFGNLGNTAGVGDISLSYSHRILERKNYHIVFTAGAILPPNKGGKRKNGLPLPMDYQTSLGSYDLIFGGSLIWNSWHLAIGYQHPLTRNENGFLHSLWPDHSRAQDYFESNRLKRGDDLVVRLERSFTKGKRTFSLSILPIYRLQRDEIIRGVRVVKLEGSDQLTLNLNFNYQYRLSEHLNFNFSYANPVIWRDTRADGLTRPVVIVLAAELKI